MNLNGANRAPATLLGAAAAGVLLWVAAAYPNRHGTGGYWAAYGLVAAAGLVFGLLRLRNAGGHPPAMFLLGFLPVLVVAGWILLGMQPHPNWFQSHVTRWSHDIGILGVVRTVGTWLGVLAFAIGYTLAATFEPFGRRRRVVTDTHDPRAADEPTAAERREVEAQREREAARERGTVVR